MVWFALHFPGGNMRDSFLDGSSLVAPTRTGGSVVCGAGSSSAFVGSRVGIWLVGTY